MEIEADETMKARWIGYAGEFSYASGIEFKDTVKSAIRLLDATTS